MHKSSHRCLACIVLRVCLAALLPAQSSPELESLLRQGAEAMRAGNASAAEADYQKATAAAPTFAPAWLDLGLAQLKEGKLTDAIASMQKSIAIDPSTRGAHLFLGIADYQTHHIDDAVANLEEAVRLDGSNPQAQMWLGIVELENGHPEQATEPLDRAAELAPKDVAILDYRVQAHMAVARQSYTQIYRLDPGSWRLHRLNAQIDAQALQHTEAIGEYQQAIKIAPKEADLYEGLGWEYRQTGQADLAQKAFEQQLTLTPGNPIAMYNLASARVDNGQAEAAIPLLEQVVKLYGAPTVADYYLGRAYAAVGKNEQAVVEFEKATTLGGETQSRSWYGLSQVYKALGKTADARAATLRFQQLHQQSERERAKDVEDWRKMNAMSEGKPNGASGNQ